MRSAFYMAEGVAQVVLTPENEHEKRILALLHDGRHAIDVRQGAFFENMAGYIRHTSTPESTMLVLRPKTDGAENGTTDDRA